MARENPASEQSLLATAAETTVKGLRDRCRQVRAGAEADERAWARRLHTTREYRDWTNVEGGYCFAGQLPPDAGARVRSALQGHLDRIFAEAGGPARGHTKPGERCEIEGIGPAPVTTVRALLDDAAISVLVRDGDDITGRSQRTTHTIPARLRRALEATYPVCGVKACANDRFLEIDHIVALEDGGRTERDNLWRICKHHHILKTLFGWVVIGSPGDRDLVPPRQNPSDDPDPP